MRLRLVSALVLAAALVVAPGAVGKAPLTGVEVCGVGACVQLSAGDAEQLWTLLDEGPAPAVAPFLVLRWHVTEGAPVETAYYVPSRRALRWPVEASGPVALWRSLDPRAAAALTRAAAGLTPFAAPAPTRVTVGGRPVRAPATYLRLFGGVHVSTWPATAWVTVAFRAAAPGPWTDGLTDIALARHGPYVTIDRWIYRIPKAMARQALRRVPLTARR